MARTIPCPSHNFVNIQPKLCGSGDDSKTFCSPGSAQTLGKCLQERDGDSPHTAPTLDNSQLLLTWNREPALHQAPLSCTGWRAGGQDAARQRFVLGGGIELLRKPHPGVHVHGSTSGKGWRKRAEGLPVPAPALSEQRRLTVSIGQDQRERHLRKRHTGPVRVP